MNETPNPPSESTAATSVEDAVKEAKMGAGWLIAMGILTVLFGGFAIATPFCTGTAAAMVLGWIVLFAGVLHFAHAFKAKNWGGGLLAAFLGFLAVACGLFMLVKPLKALLALTLLLAIYLVVDGISRIALSIQLKKLPGWGWTLFGGIVSIVLGIMIWRQWPFSAAWVPGTLIGIHLIFAGWAILFMGLAARKAAQSG